MSRQNYRGKISAKTQHMNVDYSAFEGWKLENRPSVVTVRGQIAMRDGKFVASLATGNSSLASQVTFDLELER